MSRAEFFLALQLLLPIACYVLMRGFIGNATLARFFYRLSPSLFAINLIQLFRLTEKNPTSLTFFEAFRGASISIIASPLNLGFCAILGALWLIFTFYVEGFFEHNSDKTNKGPSLKPDFFSKFLGSQICEKANLARSTCFDTNSDNDKITKKDGFSEGPGISSDENSAARLEQEELRKKPSDESKPKGKIGELIENWFNLWDLKSSILLFFALMSLLLLSKNLFTLLFAEIGLMLASQVLAKNYLENSKKLKDLQKEFDGNWRFTKIFKLPFLLYLQNFFLFLAIAATYKINGNFEFVDNLTMPSLFDASNYRWLLLLYLGGLLLLIIVPVYFFIGQMKFNPLAIFLLFFLSLGFGSLAALAKVLVYIFGIDGLKTLFENSIRVDQLLILANLTTFSLMLFFAHNLKSALFYLFFHQLTFLLFAVISLSSSGTALIYAAILGFCCNYAAAFLCANNLSLFLSSKFTNKNEDSAFQNLFVSMPVNCCLLVFSVLAMIGIAPSIVAVEMVAIISKIWHEKLILSAAIVAVNFCCLAAFAWKFIRKSLKTSETLNQNIKTDKKPAKNSKFLEVAADSDLRLIAGPLLLLIAGILCLIFASQIKIFYSN